jgi:hypothetical protein
MANNRLYIGNKETKEWVLLCKGYGGGWENIFSADKVNEFLSNQTDEGFLGGSTNLILFTEYDEEVYNDFVENGTKVDVSRPLGS